MASWTGAFELRKLTVKWSRVPTTGVVQDAAMCTYHFLNTTGGAPDDSWTTADYANVESAYDVFWNAVKAKFRNTITLSEYHWRADGPNFRPFGDELSPTLRLTPKSIAGGGAGGNELPPQCSMSVTEVTTATYDVSGVGVPGHAVGTGRTQRRNRWGRFYLPPLLGDYAATGRWASAECSAIATAVQSFYNTCVSLDFIPVMYSPTLGDAWTIDEIHVDDIVDVIRSRRYITPLTRTPKPIDAPGP